MTPGEFDEWCAKDEVEPIGHATHMLALIAWYVHSYLCKDSGASGEDFMPWLKHQNTPRAARQQAKQILAQIAGSMPNGKPR